MDDKLNLKPRTEPTLTEIKQFLQMIITSKVTQTVHINVNIAEAVLKALKEN